MAKTVIEINNLGKQYRLGEIGTATMSDDLKRFLYRVRGKEDPFLKVGEYNDRTKKGNSEYVWAIKDITFKVEEGQVLGIIGKNGAGKSTLLKILSRTTLPTIGEYKVRGRIASLLEVGTGFHPDLSGRENIFLNGAILGMRKSEIQRQFDAIVDFSGVERYIDTPVKRYSSGMYVRLAFAVAAHLEPEILIVDEVLAVGDAEFQKKCLGKMKDVSGQGRTVLFVSHNLGAIAKLCNKSVLLENGTLKGYDETRKIISEYYSNSTIAENNFIKFDKLLEKDIQVLSARLIDKTSELIAEPIDVPEKFYIDVTFGANRYIKNVHMTIEIRNSEGENVLFSDRTDHAGGYPSMDAGVYNMKMEFPNPLLNVDKYYISITCMDNDNEDNRHVVENALQFEIKDTKRFRTYYRPGAILQILNWDLIKTG